MEGPHLPCVLQAPAVKVKHRPRRGGGRHACPHCLITLGPSAHVLCTSPFTDSHCLAQVHSTTHTTRPSNRLATVVGDHAPTVLGAFHRPLFPNIQTGQITSRMPPLQSPLGPLTPFDTRGLLCSPSLLTLAASVVETTACRGGAKMSSRIWTNDTRRDEDKKRSPRAEATAARYEV